MMHKKTASFLTSILTVGVGLIPLIGFACDASNCQRYCDSSAGFYVNQNGDYSSEYCTRHAVMDLQKLAGLCLWRGGVSSVTERLEVICNDGSISEISTLQQMTYKEGVGFTTGENKHPIQKALEQRYQFINN